MDELTREYHEVANIFPLLNGQEYEDLKADIATNGLLEPIWLHQDGRIIDGRNRHRACIDTGTPPQFRTWNGRGSLVSFVVSLNLHRRHLDKGQCACIAVDIKPMYEAEAAARQAATQFGGGGNISTTVEEQGKARDQAGAAVGVSGRYVAEAEKIKDTAPELFQQVRAGEITIPQAKREMVKRERKAAPPLPSDKYRVIYADPPWSYGNSGVIGETDNYGHVGRHYPSMTISELCDMGRAVQEMAEQNAVLFMWVTSPLLEECFPVIRAWGFRYKTSFVWDKVKHNFGHYNSVRHELLLVCTRGSCTPDEQKLFDSVQTIERTDQHSEKPEEFRRIIDTLYPHGKRIELFARRPADGWEVWGNE